MNYKHNKPQFLYVYGFQVESNIVFPELSCVLKQCMYYSSILRRRLSDSGLVVLMSGHFCLQILCHLTSDLFYKKGLSMHSYKNTQHVYSTAPTNLQLGHNTHSIHNKTCNSTKCLGIPVRFYSQNAHPCCHISRRLHQRQVTL